MALSGEAEGLTQSYAPCEWLPMPGVAGRCLPGDCPRAAGGRPAPGRVEGVWSVPLELHLLLWLIRGG